MKDLFGLLLQAYNWGLFTQCVHAWKVDETHEESKSLLFTDI